MAENQERKNQTEPGSGLDRKLTPFNVWALAFGCTIGWGAFIMPGTVFLRSAGPVGSLIALELGAMAMLIISYSYHYMLQKFPSGGGQYIFARRAFGRGHGFVCAWFLGLCYLCVVPLNATALGVMGRVLFLGTHGAEDVLYTVAGYEVYGGELVLAVVPMVLFALLSAPGIRLTGKIQTFLAVVMTLALLSMLAAAMLRSTTLPGQFYPFFKPGGNVVLQVIGVAVMAPQLFIGFETPPLFSEESGFSLDHSKVIMDACVLFSAFFYIALTFLAVVAMPVGYMAWTSYIHGISFIKGPASIPTLNAARQLLGDWGVWVWSAAALAAMMTGIVGCYAATSRLLYFMSHDRLLPPWFGVLNRNRVPFHATLFCMGCAVLMPFMGRTALNWGFEMASVGASVSFAYTCLAARRYALRERRRDVALLGGIGFVFSACMAFFLLFPVPGLDCSIEPESYVCLAVWSALGAACFFRTPRRMLVVFRRVAKIFWGRQVQWGRRVKKTMADRTGRLLWKTKTSNG